MNFYPIVFWMMVTMRIICAQQSPDLKLPEGPLLKRTPSSAQWTITTQPPSGDAATGEVGKANSIPAAVGTETLKPKITMVVKGPNLIFEKIIDENNIVMETWRIGDLAMMNLNNGGWVIAPSSGTTFNTTDYSKSDFAGFDWISLNNFAGARDVMGKHCITFKDKVITLEPQDTSTIRSTFRNAALMAALKEQQDHPQQVQPELPEKTFDENSLKVDVEADIDNDTRLPVQLTYKTLDGKTIIRNYLFQPSPGTLSLPVGVENLLKTFQERQRRMTSGPAPI